MKENTWFSGVDFNLAIKNNWGPWIYDRINLLLKHENGYSVDLRECNSSAEILDWIFQVHGKSWATGDTVLSLLEAFEDLIDPQANVCPWGVEKPFNAVDHLFSRRILEVVHEKKN